jgi:hypothetical protein
MILMRSTTVLHRPRESVAVLKTRGLSSAGSGGNSVVDTVILSSMFRRNNCHPVPIIARPFSCDVEKG